MLYSKCIMWTETCNKLLYLMRIEHDIWNRFLVATCSSGSYLHTPVLLLLVVNLALERSWIVIDCHDKMSKKRTQSTLAKFNFTQHVKHKGKRVKVDIPPYVTSCDADLIKCLHCDMKFKNQQGLSVHVLCKHER